MGQQQAPELFLAPVHDSFVESVQNAAGFLTGDKPEGAIDGRVGGYRFANVCWSRVGENRKRTLDFEKVAEGARVVREAHKDLDDLLIEVTFGPPAAYRWWCCKFRI